MVTNKLVWMIGGAQGSGVDSSANVFARACTMGGLFVYGKREYYSNIMGEHSYFLVRVEDRPVRVHLDTVNLLATFDAETLVKHFLEVGGGGGIIYDPSLAGVRLAQIPTLERRVAYDVRSHLANRGRGEKIQDLLDEAESRGVRLYPLPYNDLLKNLAEQFGETKLSKLSRMVNTMAVAASFCLLKYPLGLLESALRQIFRAKPKIAEMNIEAAKKTYAYVEKEFGNEFSYRLEAVEAKEQRLYLQGNQAVALGKLLAGCRFQTYYPISPATDESEYLEANEILKIRLPQLMDDPQIEEAKTLEELGGSIVVVQTEDEIAAITMSTGAALTGVRASTSTSGPGFSLMVEGLGWAGINEVPVVVTYYQRCGPSTGMPTRQEQGDLRFSLHAGHGEFPRIIVASGDLEECFYDAVRCFNYAERYQLPVVHLVDKALANSTGTYPIFDLSGVKIQRGLLLSEAELEKLNGEGGYKRFRFTDTGISPRSVLGQNGGIHWLTGDEHDELGHITEDPVIRMRMMEKRMKKLETAGLEIPEAEKAAVHGGEEAELTVVSWGSTKGAILEAMELLRAEGASVNFLQLRILSPFPKKLTSRILSKSKRRVDVEMNYSAQLAGLVREHTGYAMDHCVVKYNGRPISRDEAYHALKQIVNNEAPERVVLTHGA